jgi:integrase
VSQLFKRCGCTEIVDGKRRQLGGKCPKLRRADGTWNPRHGTWTYAMEGPGKGGKRKPIVRGGFDTAKEAQQALDEARARLKHGIVVNDRMTVGRYLDEWLAAKGDIRPSTLRGYQQHIKKYLRPGLGHLRLAEVRLVHVAECLAEVSSSDANRQRVRATLRAAFNDAIREGLILINPAALVKLPSGARPKGLVWTPARVQRWEEAVERLAATDADDPARALLETAAQPPSAVMVWTPAQLGTFLDAADRDLLYALFHLIAHRGLRRGESCGLAWTDVDLDAARLTVRQQIVQLGWGTYEDKPKSDAGDREVALDAGTVAALRAHRRRQIASRLRWGPAWVDSGKVFTREDGSVLHPATVTDRFQALAAAAKLPPIRLHDLRHGAASLMLAAGVAPKVVQETLGHSSITLTLDTYTSVYDEVAAEAAEAAAALVPRAGTSAHTSHTQPEPGTTQGPGNPWSDSGAGGARTHDLTDYESAALTN